MHRKQEIIGGMTTFFTMSYILVVNPAILSTPGTGMPFDGVLTATVMLSFSMTLLMGLYAKLPFAVAPGMGINAFFTYHILLGQKVPYPIALGIVFWAGVLFLLVSVTRIREQIARAIPPSLRIASATGIGIFLSFIGLRNAGLVVADETTFVKFGDLTVPSMLTLLGVMMGVGLLKRKSPFAFLGPMGLITVLGWALGYVRLPQAYLSQPDFSLFFELDVVGALKLSLLPAMISILFTDLFDSISTFVGVSCASGLLDEKGEPKNLKQGLIVDSFATLGAGLMGTSSGTAYIESSAGIEAGGRTGFASVVTALCFLPCFFLAPLTAMVPSYATAPVLIVVGALMFKTAKDLSYGKLEDLIPAYLTILLIPLTFSITQGILWGFVTHVILYVIVGRRREVPVFLWALATISVGLLILESKSVS